MTSMSDLDKISANREGFNLRARAHMQSSYYDVERFKQGHNMLRRLEREELGDVSGKSLLELQCHIGVNSLSLARMGAKVTGTDIADDAIDIARGLATELDLDANFVQANLYDLPKVLDGQFDMVFTGYGTLSFLPDIAGWAKIAAQYVKPGGTLTIVEIHPILTLFGDVDGELRVARSLFQSRDVHHEMSATYADRIEDEVEVETHSIYGWRWTIEEVLNSLIDAGLTIERVREVPYDARQRLPLMVPDGDHNWRIQGDPIPLSFACVARK
ncbi:class I SAM-dependent methyltransferase [Kitasatospora aureofaciens]|uniref:Type 12 methyltransferase n=2 Tax=Kitasatospora aureofaciens TaxID=1894 RepID=A0A8H9HWX5_KITAU|nr:methyltransferase domain-containing protein [Kitasatospora aureofaciens]UKZ03110.1 methyltransferase domain-containing protein [Streptomyces viridifaciens]GGU95686.1 type 12 methyltransferase [Kitasatospora aureofaciens]